MMIRKRKLFFLALLTVLIFLATIFYLMRLLSNSEKRPINTNEIIHEKIYKHLATLPEFYKIRSTTHDSVVDTFIKNINHANSPIEDLDELWNEVSSWVTRSQLTNFSSAKFGTVVQALKNAKIIHSDVDSRGTQLKLLLTLEGKQKIVFKPKWYDLEKIIDGPVYAGKDRFGSEILAFYLSVILNKPLVPLSVKRTVSFKNEIMPVASPLLQRTSFRKNNTRTCIYGKCYYCKKEDPICEDERFLITGAVIVNINTIFKIHRSPWQRSYKTNKLALWQTDSDYCNNKVKNNLNNQRIYDLIDIAIFDFLLQNGDRHHYEIMNDVVVFLDNGKGLGNPYRTFLDILAPLYQCCRLRHSTMERLKLISGGFVTAKLQLMPDIESIVTQEHLKAIEERLLLIYATIEYCSAIK